MSHTKRTIITLCWFAGALVMAFGLGISAGTGDWQGWGWGVTGTVSFTVRALMEYSQGRLP